MINRQVVFFRHPHYLFLNGQQLSNPAHVLASLGFTPVYTSTPPSGVYFAPPGWEVLEVHQPIPDPKAVRITVYVLDPKKYIILTHSNHTGSWHTDITPGNRVHPFDSSETTGRTIHRIGLLSPWILHPEKPELSRECVILDLPFTHQFQGSHPYHDGKALFNMYLLPSPWIPYYFPNALYQGSPVSMFQIQSTISGVTTTSIYPWDITLIDFTFISNDFAESPPIPQHHQLTD